MAMKLRLLLPVLLLAFMTSAYVYADGASDRVSRLVSQLATGSDYKVRLSAALNLAKLRDMRAVPALARAVERDRDKNVRAVAATSLAKLIDASTPDGARNRAVDVLAKAAKKDRDSFVRERAERALKEVRAIAKSGKGGSGTSIYVNVGAMSVTPKGAGELRNLMRRTAEKQFKSKAKAMMTSWPGGGTPSAKELRASGAAGYHVDGTLTSLQMSESGNSTLVTCKISMLIATYPEKSIFGFLDGGAKVQAGTSAKDIQYARQDCVAAVVEDLVAKKVIPTIETRSRPQIAKDH